MPSPFPGMNPFLEASAIWPGFHSSMIATIRTAINGIAPGQYFADIEQRVFVVKPGDVDQVIIPILGVAVIQCHRHLPELSGYIFL